MADVPSSLLQSGGFGPSAFVPFFKLPNPTDLLLRNYSDISGRWQSLWAGKMRGPVKTKQPTLRSETFWREVVSVNTRVYRA